MSELAHYQAALDAVAPYPEGRFAGRGAGRHLQSVDLDSRHQFYRAAIDAALDAVAPYPERRFAGRGAGRHLQSIDPGSSRRPERFASQ